LFYCLSLGLHSASLLGSRGIAYGQKKNFSPTLPEWRIDEALAAWRHFNGLVFQVRPDENITAPITGVANEAVPVKRIMSLIPAAWEAALVVCAKGGRPIEAEAIREALRRCCKDDKTSRNLEKSVGCREAGDGDNAGGSSDWSAFSLADGLVIQAYAANGDATGAIRALDRALVDAGCCPSPEHVQSWVVGAAIAISLSTSEPTGQIGVGGSRDAVVALGGNKSRRSTALQLESRARLELGVDAARCPLLALAILRACRSMTITSTQRIHGISAALLLSTGSRKREAMDNRNRLVGGADQVRDEETAAIEDLVERISRPNSNMHCADSVDHRLSIGRIGEIEVSKIESVRPFVWRISTRVGVWPAVVIASAAVVALADVGIVAEAARLLNDEVATDYLDDVFEAEATLEVRSYSVISKVSLIMFASFEFDLGHSFLFSFV
jgi:hypothetical protein